MCIRRQAADCRSEALEATQLQELQEVVNAAEVHKEAAQERDNKDGSEGSDGKDGRDDNEKIHEQAVSESSCKTLGMSSYLVIIRSKLK